MHKVISFRILKSIDDYIKGRLGPQEVDALWVEILEHPEYYPSLRTEAGLRKRYLDKKKSEAGILTRISRLSANRVWMIAASILAFALFINLYLGRVKIEIEPAFSEISFLHLIAPDITRSSADELSEFDQALHHSFQLAVTGNLEDALTEYLKLQNSTEIQDKQTVLNYNLGIIYYNGGDFTASVRHFESVNCPELNDFAYIESCYWLSANSLIAIQKYEQAHHAAVQTLKMNGSYRDEAEELVQKLQSLP